MISKAQIQFIQSLHLKKFRQQHRLFIAEGTKIANELLACSHLLHSVYASEDWIKQNSHRLNAAQVVEVNEQSLKKISLLASPNEVLCLVKMEANEFNPKQLATEFCLALHEVQDPGNLGTIIRLADWFGIDTVLCSEGTVDAYNPKVVQATMGSFLRCKVHYCDLKQCLEFAQKNNIPSYAAVLDGTSIYKTKLQENGLLVMGNESKGISEELLRLITYRISIPSFSKMNSDSLNVSIATAILCSELRRTN